MILKIRRIGSRSAHGNEEGVHSQVNRVRSGPGAVQPRDEVPKAGVRAKEFERTPCSNIQCTNKLKHRLGTTASMSHKLCARCNRLHGRLRSLPPEQLRDPYKPPVAEDVAYDDDIIQNLLKFDQPMAGNAHSGPHVDLARREKPVADPDKEARQALRAKKREEMDKKMRYGVKGASKKLRNKYNANDLAYLGEEFDFTNSDDVFDAIWDSVIKGKFRGYSKNTISGRAERAGKAKAWNQSRKNKRRRTRNIYARQKGRGNVRPAMRRQLGAGGSRQETKR